MADSDPTPASDTPAAASDDERVLRRAELLDAERSAGSDDPVAQAAEILEESDARTLLRGSEADPAGDVERRSAEDTVDPGATGGSGAGG